MRQLKITKQITQRNENSINHYFQEINKYPMITAEEEVELTERIRSGDDAALNKLVVSNLRFVISVAKQYQNQGLAFPDLINEGNLGLVKAAHKFDEKRGFKFISYAVWWIRQAIIQAISEQTRIVRLPLNKISSINKVNKAIPFLEQTHEREPTNEEIAAYLDLNDEEIITISHIKKRQISFDQPISTKNEDDVSMYDFICTDEVPSPDNNLVQESFQLNINRALEKLTDREAAVLKMSFGLGNSTLLSLQDIAAKFHMSSERVRQIRNRGLIKLKTLLKEKHYMLAE